MIRALVLALLLGATPAAAGYRDVLIDAAVPAEGLHVGDPIPLCLTTTETDIHYYLQVYDGAGRQVHAWARGWIIEPVTCFVLATWEGDAPGWWHVNVFIWGGAEFDGDGITIPVAP